MSGAPRPSPKTVPAACAETAAPASAEAAPPVPGEAAPPIRPEAVRAARDLPAARTTGGPTLAELGEDGVLARILARLPGSGAEVGPGDDAAVTAVPGRLVSSADMLVEGEDFLASWLDPRRLGVKAGAQNLADVCAMGARPTALLLSLAAPGHTPVDLVEGIVEGLAAEAARAGAAVVGGDLSGADQIVVAVTAFGGLPAGVPALTRGGARPGDALWLGGRTGWAAAGLDLLLAGVPAARASDAGAPGGRTDDAACTAACADACADGCAAAIEAQRAPQPDYAAIARLRAALADAGERRAHDGRAALIDLSDGLLSDAGRIARASGVVLDLDGTALDVLAAPLVPVAAHLLAHRGETGSARELAREWVLTGGEDHGFLAAAPAGADPVGWARIGRVRAGEAAVRVDGAPAGAGLGGFRHFRGR